LIVDQGGKLGGGVSKNLDFLVVGSDAGPSKLDKAKKLGLKMLSEQEFEDFLTERQAAAPPAETRPAPAAGGGAPLAGKTFVVTGTLMKGSRKEVEKRIADRGGKTTGEVTKDVSFVVAGPDAGAKLDRARELKVPVLSEEELEKLLQGPASAPGRTRRQGPPSA
jgi:DNA ligase (NAD+)